MPVLIARPLSRRWRLSAGWPATASSALQNDWTYFRAQLQAAVNDGRTFSRVILRGSQDHVGKVCVGSGAQTLATNLAAGTQITNVSCLDPQGNTSMWSTYGAAGSYHSIAAEPSNGCTAMNVNSYVVRPDVPSSNWGGINTASCSAPSQHMEVLFDY